MHRINPAVLLAVALCVASGSIAWTQKPRTPATSLDSAALQALAAFKQVARPGGQGLPRGLQADGEVDEFPTTFRCPFWIRLADNLDFQTIERHLPSSGFPGGHPFVYTIERGTGWMFEEAHQPYEPYLPTRPPAIDRASTRARRDVLRLLMGIAPDLAVEASLVTLSPISADHVNGQTAFDVTDAAGTFATLYFDTGSHLPVALTYRFVSLLPQRHDVQIQERFGDYRMATNVLLPFAFTREEDGKSTSVITIARYQTEEFEGLR